MNPLGYVIEETRAVLIEGNLPDIPKLILFLITTTIMSELALKSLKRYQRKIGDYL